LVDQVIPRLATLDSIPPAAVRELNEAIEDLLASEAQHSRVSVGGINMAAKLLNRIDGDRVESILGQIKAIDADLAQQIQNNMFMFEDLIRLDDRNFQMLLRTIDQKLLASALKGADAKLLDKVMRNLSQRSAEMLREEISSRGPMRVTEIDAARQEIVGIAQRLEREGTIILPTDGSDMVS
jgi:flagellar motor switch protein FliG